MDNQDAVMPEQAVESAPTQETNPQTQEESPVESIQPEKVSESVPYDRFHEVNSKAKSLAEENAWLKSQMSAPAAEPMANIPQLDPESEAGVRAVARQEWDEMQRQTFVSKHQTELNNNPILAGTVRELIARENALGKLADRETVFAQAKKMLEETMKPVVKEAQAQAFSEGQEKAILKGQAGSVGSTSYKEPAVDDGSMSASDYKKKYNIPSV